jgi:hypothetical protein
VFRSARKIWLLIFGDTLKLHEKPWRCVGSHSCSMHVWFWGMVQLGTLA